MSARACVHVSAYEKADGGIPPNRFIEAVTVDLRVHYPPVPGQNVLISLDVLDDAYENAKFELYQRHKELNP